MPVWNPDLPTTEDFRDQWRQIPDNAEFTNGFRAQWEQFLADVDAGRAHPYDLAAGVRGLQLAEAGLTSSSEGRRVPIERFEA
jgi:predicted dehydrogenase